MNNKLITLLKIAIAAGLLYLFLLSIGLMGGAFKDTKKAFIQEDDAKAKATYHLESRIVKACDAILINLAASDLSTNEGVCYALIARYYKRIAAHLVNISTSVVLPISQLDYFDEKKAEGDDAPK